MDISNSHYRGLRFRSTPGYFLEAHTRFFIAYLFDIQPFIYERTGRTSLLFDIFAHRLTANEALFA